jgi:hypothetical protein
VAQSFIFINYHQALRFGHVAWGFTLSEGVYRWGSSDHLLRRPMSDVIALAKYSYVPPGGDIDFWSEQGSYEQMLQSMAAKHHIQYQDNRREYRYHINYHDFKVLNHENANPERALQEIELIKAGGWSVVANNCIDQTYRILEAFGAGSTLVDPKQRYQAKLTFNGGSDSTLKYGRLSTILPKKWFAAAIGESYSLEQHRAKNSQETSGRQVVS